MVSRLVALVALAACYSARPGAGAPCGPGGECPTGQTCSAEGLCVLPGGGFDVDAAPSGDGAIDRDAAPADAARADATPADAAAMPDSYLRTAPIFRGVAAASGVTTTTMISSPAGTNIGDLLLAHTTNDGPTDSTTMATPAGWTRLVESNAAQDRFIVVVFYRLAAAPAETFAFDFPNDSNTIHLMAFGNVHPTTPIDVSAIDALTDTSQPTAPSVTTTQTETMLVTMYSLDLSADAYQPVPGMTEIYDAPSNGLRVAGSIAPVSVAGPTGTKVAQRTGNDPGPTINATVAIAPR